MLSNPSAARAIFPGRFRRPYILILNYGFVHLRVKLTGKSCLAFCSGSEVLRKPRPLANHSARLAKLRQTKHLASFYLNILQQISKHRIGIGPVTLFDR